MGTQPSAAIVVSLSVQATNYEDTLQFNSTVGSYTTDALNMASSLWQYLNNVTGVAATPNTTLKFIVGMVRINDVTAPRTPYGMYTTYVNGAPVATFQENAHFRWNFQLGPYDFQDQPSLAAALTANIAQAVAFTPNY
jgi:cephalosporin-C deacetylase-like acetyl esterase